MKLPSFFRNRMTEFSLTIIFILGFFALVVTSNGVFLSRASLQGFLTYLAVPTALYWPDEFSSWHHGRSELRDHGGVNGRSQRANLVSNFDWTFLCHINGRS